MKKIAFYIGDLGLGGAERVITNLANYFNEQGYEVVMVTKLKSEKEYVLNSGIQRIIADITPEEETGSRIGNLRARINKLRGIWKETKPDIIVSFIRKNNLMAIASAHPLHIPVVVSVRSAPARELAGRITMPLTKFMFHFAAGIVLQTGQAKAFFSKSLQKKSIVLPNSINPAFMEKASTLKRTAMAKSIVAVGRIDSNKNQKMLVEAFLNIADDYPDWKLDLYGDGEGRGKLEKQISDNKNVSRVIFHGRVDNVPEVMSEAGIFVLPSKIEGMPNALIEAMTLGLPCISTDCPCGGPADLIKNGENGILIPVDDRAALEENLRKLMSDDKLRGEMGEKAGKIIEVLSPEIVNEKWKEYLLSICNA